MKKPPINRSIYVRHTDLDPEFIANWFKEKFKKYKLKKRRYFDEKVYAFKGTFRIRCYMCYELKDEQIIIQAWITYRESHKRKVEFLKTDVLGLVNDYQFDELVSEIVAEFDLINEEAFVLL